MKKTGIIAFTEHGCVLGEKLLRDLQKQDQEVYGFVKSKYVELPEKHPFRKVKGTLREWAEEWIPRTGRNHLFQCHRDRCENHRSFCGK